MLQGLIYSVISALPSVHGDTGQLGYMQVGRNEMMQYRFTYAVVLLALFLFSRTDHFSRLSLRIWAVRLYRPDRLLGANHLFCQGASDYSRFHGSTGIVCLSSDRHSAFNLLPEDEN